MSKWVLLFLLTFLPKLAYGQEMLKIAVVDSGLNLKDPRFQSALCKSGHKDFTGHGIMDEVGHGTHVFGLIQKYAGTGNYCIVVIKYWSPKIHNSRSNQNFIDALNYSTKIKSNVVNVSTSSMGKLFFEHSIFTRNKDVLFIVAAGNDDCDLDDDDCDVYPAKYRDSNIIPVGNAYVDDEGRYFRGTNSNWGSSVVWEVGTNVLSTLPIGEGYMSGTSMATAVHTGRVVHEILK